MKAFAWAIEKRSDRDGRFHPEFGPGEHWWFKKCHPLLTLCKSDNLEHSRAEALNPEIVEDYFKLLETTLKDNNLLNTPRRLYNCDETFLPLDYTREKAVTTRGMNQTQGTTVYCVVLLQLAYPTLL